MPETTGDTMGRGGFLALIFFFGIITLGVLFLLGIWEPGQFAAQAWEDLLDTASETCRISPFVLGIGAVYLAKRYPKRIKKAVAPLFLGCGLAMPFVLGLDSEIYNGLDISDVVTLIVGIVLICLAAIWLSRQNLKSLVGWAVFIVGLFFFIDFVAKLLTGFGIVEGINQINGSVLLCSPLMVRRGREPITRTSEGGERLQGGLMVLGLIVVILVVVVWAIPTHFQGAQDYLIDNAEYFDSLGVIATIIVAIVALITAIIAVNRTRGD